MFRFLFDSLKSSLSSALLILKFIIPLYILADILLYFDLLQSVSFLFTPITGLIDLPAEAAIALASGILINIYAAIAFAAPLELSPYQWTILGVFLGVCHALVVESAIMTRLGISSLYSVSLRCSAAFVAAFPIRFLPMSLFAGKAGEGQASLPQHEDFWQMLLASLGSALLLSVKIILLISAIIVFMDLLKASPFIKTHMEKVNSSFSIIVGQLLGITYGAGILIREVNNGNLSRKDIFFVGTFLMICHSIIEDVLLFVIFGANYWIIIALRLATALIFSFFLLWLFTGTKKKSLLLDLVVRP